MRALALRGGAGVLSRRISGGASRAAMDGGLLPCRDWFRGVAGGLNFALASEHWPSGGGCECRFWW